MISCPKPAAIAEAREARRIEAQRAERVQKLVSTMSPELKGPLPRAAAYRPAPRRHQALSGVHRRGHDDVGGGRGAARAQVVGPYAVRRYNGSGVNSFHYQYEVLRRLTRPPLTA